MNSKLFNHLKERKIAPILFESDEKNNEVALKLMCILDHTLEKRHWYGEIEKHPKLLRQLLNFKSFASFNYWKYAVPQKFYNEYILVCRVCQLQGPYYLILSHMATTHNSHLGCRTCLWCNRVSIKEHIKFNTLEQCHAQYLQTEDITDSHYPKIIVKFYDMIQDLARILDVLHARNNYYTGKGRKRKEDWFDVVGSDEEIDRSVMVYRNYSTNRVINEKKLNILLSKVIQDFYGGEKSLEFLKFIKLSGKQCSSDKPNVIDDPKMKKKEKKKKETSKSETITKQSSNKRKKSASEPVQSTSSGHDGNNDGEKEFAQSIAVFLSNLENENMKRRAKLEIQTVALNYSQMAMQMSMKKNSTDK